MHATLICGYLWTMTVPECLAVFAAPASTLHAAPTNCCPGTDCLSKKRHLAVTLHNAFGDEAWQMLPRTYRCGDTLWAGGAG